mgnify:FL=1
MIRYLGRARAGISLPEVEHDDQTLTLHWPDGETSTVDHRTLRVSCQCAVCVDEYTGEPRVDESQVPEDIHPTDIERVGNYALSINWSDGHTTGFFPYSRIRELVRTREGN